MDRINLPGLRKVLSSFAVGGNIELIVPTGSGHINDSFHATVPSGEGPGYLLQRINHQIFRDIPSLMQNIDLVTRHIREKIRKGGFQIHPSLQAMQVLEIVPALDGELFSVDREGNFWRVYTYIAGSRSYDRLVSPALAAESGRAFGWFLSITSGVDAGTLTETIPRFHNIGWRLEQFDTACIADTVSRVGEVQKEIGFVTSRRREMLAFGKLASGEEMPLRVTHNDTKCNNILFDGENRPICIVDLDTVMPGSVLYDFGDAIRTGASTAAEDEQDPEKISLDLELYRAYATGFVETAGIVLTREERENMGASARFMTYLIGLRFLTDHLQGDTYYKIRFPGHNLQRARNQFALLTDMETKRIAMDEPFLIKPK